MRGICLKYVEGVDVCRANLQDRSIRPMVSHPNNSSAVALNKYIFFLHALQSFGAFRVKYEMVWNSNVKMLPSHPFLAALLNS